MTEHVEKFNQCSKCGEEVTEDSPRYLACVSLLKHLFPPLEAPDGLCAEGAEYGFFDNNATIRVVTLGGEERDIRFSPGRQIQAVKADIENAFGVEPEKQRLLFNEKELEVPNLDICCSGLCFYLSNRKIITIIAYFRICFLYIQNTVLQQQFYNRPFSNGK